METDSVDGPVTVELGNIGKLKVPQGYQFTGAEAARRFFERQRQAIPAGLLGLMAPAFTPPGMPQMQIVYQYTDAGYVKDKGATNLNADMVMKGIRANADNQNLDLQARNLQVMGTPQWELKPKYDPASHTVEWAINVSGTINHTVRYFSRHGWIDAVCIRTASSVPFLMPQDAVALNPGEAYADFKQDDQVASLTVATSIPSDGKPQAVAGMAAGMLPIWIGLSLAASAAIVAFVLVVKRLRHKPVRSRVVATALPDVTPAPQPVSSPVPPAGKPAPAVTETATAAPPAPASKPKPAPLPVRPAPLSRPMPAFNSQQSLRRKRAFDYNRYFADLMSTVSSHGPAMESTGANGAPAEPEKLSPAPTPVSSGTPVQQSLFTANLELIAHQTSFIEEQRRLIQEQARLIEEKSRLIAEKNQLLKMQSELMENKLL